MLLEIDRPEALIPNSSFFLILALITMQLVANGDFNHVAKKQIQ